MNSVLIEMCCIITTLPKKKGNCNRLYWGCFQSPASLPVRLNVCQFVEHEFGIRRCETHIRCQSRVRHLLHRFKAVLGDCEQVAASIFFFCTTCWHDPCKAHLALRFFNVIIFDTICWKHIILWNLSCVSTRTLFATYAQAASRHLSTMPFLIDSRTAPLESIQKHLRSKLPQICRFLQGDGNFSPLELILYNKLPSSWYFSNSNSP